MLAKLRDNQEMLSVKELVKLAEVCSTREQLFLNIGASILERQEHLTVKDLMTCLEVFTKGSRTIE